MLVTENSTDLPLNQLYKQYLFSEMKTKMLEVSSLHLRKEESILLKLS